MRGFLIKLGLVFGVLIIWFWSNIQGYYRFKQYCAREGGLKVYGKVLPDQGWLAVGSDPYNYKAPFYLGKVAFVRYQDATGARFDVYAKPNPWPKDPEYIFQPVDKGKPVLYILKYVHESVLNELRLGVNKSIVLSTKNNKEIISYTSVSYSHFDRDKTFLNAPSGEYCPSLPFREEDFFKIIK
jgi:hypothetical protein